MLLLTNPIRLRQSSHSWFWELIASSRPFISTSPSVGVRYPISTFRIDVFPDPLPPRMTQCCPFSTLQLTSLRISFPFRRTVTFSISNTGNAIVGDATCMDLGFPMEMFLPAGRGFWPYPVNSHTQQGYLLHCIPFGLLLKQVHNLPQPPRFRENLPFCFSPT